MAINIHFNGQVFGPFADEDAEVIRDNVVRAAQTGDIVRFGAEVDGSMHEAVWTLGAPISFQDLAEG